MYKLVLENLNIIFLNYEIFIKFVYHHVSFLVDVKDGLREGN